LDHQRYNDYRRTLADGYASVRNGIGTITVSANIAGLTAGTYNGTVQIAATGAPILRKTQTSR